MQGLQSLGKTLGGGFDRLMGLQEAKRGREHETGLEAMRQKGLTGRQEMSDEAAKARVRMTGQEQRETDAATRNAAERVVEELFPDATPMEKYNRIKELMRAGNPKQQQEYLSAWGIMDSKWKLYRDGLQKDELGYPDYSAIQWDAFKTELMDAMREENEGRNLGWTDEQIESWAENFITSRRGEVAEEIVDDGDVDTPGKGIDELREEGNRLADEINENIDALTIPDQQAFQDAVDALKKPLPPKGETGRNYWTEKEQQSITAPFLEAIKTLSELATKLKSEDKGIIGRVPLGGAIKGIQYPK